jgi:hypothetical protein
LKIQHGKITGGPGRFSRLGRNTTCHGREITSGGVQRDLERRLPPIAVVVSHARA